MTIPRFLISIVLALLLALLVAAPAAHAWLSTPDGEWVWQAPTPQGRFLGDVTMVDPYYVWAVGPKGAILHSVDGGHAWGGQRADPLWDLAGVGFADAGTGWIVGSDGLIAKTTDGGATWTPQTSGTTDGLSDVAVGSTETAWALSLQGVLLQTTDGGTTWVAQNPSGDPHYWHVTCVGGTRAWAFGTTSSGAQAVLARTTDGGATWTQSDLAQPLGNLDFVDGSTGWATGDGGSVWRTTDGGTTWTPAGSGMYDLFALAAVDGQTAWVAGSGGQIRRTTDGGATWDWQQGVAAGDTFFSISLADKASGVAVGDGGEIVVTTDGGTTWVDLRGAPPRPQAQAADFVDPSNGWLVGGDCAIWRTSDGGWTWTQQHAGGLLGLWSVVFRGTQRGWAVGDQGLIMRTTNGGAAWSQQQVTTERLTDVTFPDVLHGWAVGDRGTIERTTDGGANWQAQSLTTQWYLTAVFFTSALNGWTGGESARLLHTTDGGANWQAAAVDPTFELEDIVFIDDQRGWAAGSVEVANPPLGTTRMGTVLRTTDGGASWTQHTLEVATDVMDLGSLSFVDAARGWAVGERRGFYVPAPVVYFTTDGGQTWTDGGLDLLPMNLTGTDFVDADNGWLFGDVLLRKRGPDVVPPVTKTSGAGGRWCSRTATVVFKPSDALSGVALTESDLDPGAASPVWEPGATTMVVADRTNHTQDGTHTIVFRSLDNDGNLEGQRTSTVNIDTRRPVPKALSYTTTMRNARTPLKYRISDGRPNGGWATVTIKIKNLDGKVVKELSPVRKSVNKNQTAHFTCRLGRGVYKFYVYATDRAGNTQLKPGKDFLIVI